jgi:hypothetical protein
MKKAKAGNSDWFRKYPLVNDPKKKSNIATTRETLERAKRRKKLDLIKDARELGNELGEVWDD